jgi:hypothetical protein
MDSPKVESAHQAQSRIHTRNLSDVWVEGAIKRQRLRRLLTSIREGSRNTALFKCAKVKQLRNRMNSYRVFHRSAPRRNQRN